MKSIKLLAVCFITAAIKWIESDIPRGLATGLASEYNEKIYLALRFPAVLPEGVFKDFEAMYATAHRHL